MARTGPLHWVGVFFLLAAAVCLLIATISAPIINDIGILKVTLTNSSDIRHSSIQFGTFGYCVLDAAPGNTDNDYCTGKHIGYAPSYEIAQADNTDFSRVGSDSADALTRAMILHPVACGIAFLAFLFSCGAGVIGSLVGALVAAIAWIVTLVVMAIDFSWAGIIRNHVNGDGSGSTARYGVAMWLVLAAMISLFLGMFIVLFTCFSARRAKKREQRYSKEQQYPQGQTARVGRRKRFGLF
ncbi:hypothetical protein MMC25_007737 [Agyrium rufum]|nr:hypothetical protein [Agyrium rufum]